MLVAIRSRGISTNTVTAIVTANANRFPEVPVFFSTVVGDEIVVSAQESMAHQEHHKKVQTTLFAG